MAKRAPFVIQDKVVAPGERKTIHVPVSYLSDHTPVTMSLHVVHGKKDGPTMFVSAGIHGNEVIGIEIVRRLLKSASLKNLKGTLIVIPIVNTFGFINKSRYLPDRRDLNRSFPGSQTGSLAARLANLFMKEVVERSDIGIDLHSAAVDRTNYPQTRISPQSESGREMAETFGAPIIIESPIREGSLRKAAVDVGTEVLIYEAGEGMRFDEFSVRAGLAGILRVLRSLEMISGRGVSAAKIRPQFCQSTRWLRAPMGGLFRSYKADGTTVAEGDVLGSISDPFGENEVEILSPEAGIIVGRAVMPVVNEGDAVFHLAKAGSIRKADNVLADHSAQMAEHPMFDEDEII